MSGLPGMHPLNRLPLRCSIARLTIPRRWVGMLDWLRRRTLKSKAATVEEYLDELSEERREAVSAVRNAVLSNLPDGYEETMDFGMICHPDLCGDIDLMNIYADRVRGQRWPGRPWKMDFGMIRPAKSVPGTWCHWRGTPIVTYNGHPLLKTYAGISSEKNYISVHLDGTFDAAVFQTEIKNWSAHAIGGKILSVSEPGGGLWTATRPRVRSRTWASLASGSLFTT